MRPAMSCYVTRLLSAVALVASPAIQTVAQETTPPNGNAALDTIEAAWKARTNRIRSLAMRVDSEEFIKGWGDKPKDRYRDPRPETGRAFKIAIEYAFRQGKASLIRSGSIIDPRDPEKASQQKLRFAFDGREFRSLNEQTDFPVMGSFEKRESPGGPIMQNADLLAIHLWTQPSAALRAFGAQNMTTTIEEQPVEVDGVSCRRIRCLYGTSPRTITLDLDPARGWLPLQWQVWNGRRDSELSTSLAINYGDDSKVGPVVKAWVYTRLDPAGGFDQIRKAKVAEYQANGDIDDNRFTIVFPIGARVSEKVSDNKSRQYIQKASGLELIERRDY